MKTQRQGSGLLVIAFALCIITSIIGMATAKISSNIFASLHSSRISLQANEYAEDKAEILKATTYEKLSSQSKTAVEDSSNYYDQVDVTTQEQTKNISIKVYYGQETQPRATASLVRKSNANTGCPVGTIIAWPSATAPRSNGVWLRCDGSAIPAQYTILRTLLNRTTTPNTTIGSFLRGYGTYDSDHVSGELLEQQEDTTFKLEGSFYTYPPQFIAHYGTIAINGYHGPWDGGYWRQSNVEPTGPVFSGNNTHPSYATKFDRQDGKSHNNYTYRYPIKFDNSLSIRTSDETRPINVAVYFYIKAL